MDRLLAPQTDTPVPSPGRTAEGSSPFLVQSLIPECEPQVPDAGFKTKKHCLSSPNPDDHRDPSSSESRRETETVPSTFLRAESTRPPRTRLNIAGWNIGGACQADALQALRHSESVSFDLVCLQEMPRRDVGWQTTTLEEFTVVQYRHDDQQWRGNAVCFRSTLFQVVRRKGCRFGMWLRLRHVSSLDEFWIGSSRLSTGVTSDVTAEEARELCRLLPPTLLPVVVLADLNTKLRWTGSCGPEGAFLPTDARSSFLTSELANFGLKLKPPQRSQWTVPTSRPRRAKATGHQIDGVVFKHTRVYPTEIRVDSYKQIGGDHDRICTSLLLKSASTAAPLKTPTRPRFVCKELPSCEIVNQAVLEDLARKCTKPKTSERYRDPEAVKALYLQAKRSRSEQDWKRAHKARREAQDAWRKKKLEKAAACNWAEYRSTKQQGGSEWAVGFVEEAEIQNKSPLRWTVDHFRTLFQQTEPREVPAWTKEVDSGSHFTVEELEAAVQRGKGSKAVGEDLVSFELLKELAKDKPTAQALLAWMERLRCGEPLPDQWLRTIVTLLPKKDQVKSPADLRPISLGSAASKLFGTMLLFRTRQHIGPIGPAQCAHGGRQTADYVHAALRSFSLDTEWKLGMSWCRIDIRKAFDTVGRDKALRLLRDRLPPSMYSEYRCWERLFHEGTAVLRTPWGEATVPQSRGIRQGSVESPFLFAVAIEQALYNALSSKDWPSFMPAIPDLPLSELLYMDDTLLWAASKQDMRKKYCILRDELAKWGLKVNAEKTQYYHSPFSTSPGPIALDGQVIECSSSMGVFGIQMSVPIKPSTLMDAGIAKGTAKFWANKQVFLARAPLKQKLKLFNSVVTGSALWYCCSIPPTAQAMGALNSAQLELTAKMIGFRRRTDETWCDFRQRSLRGTRQILCNHRISRWSSCWLQRYWDFKGHIARAWHRPFPTASAVLDRFRDCTWWEEQTRSPHGIRHPSSFYPHLSNEEKSLNSITRSPNWRTQAQDTTLWQQLKPTWVERMDVAWTSGRQLALSH